jgi:tRNA(fMet)-specific endonuclease VapC
LIALDTNLVIAAINGRPGAVRARLAEEFARGTRISISSVVLFELRYGIAKSSRPAQNAAILEVFLSSPIEASVFDVEAAADAGTVRAQLERLGTPIGPYDILIAAHARVKGAILVTANGREFSRVPGLHCVDWSSSG